MSYTTDRFVLGAALLLCLSSTAVVAQTAEPSYKADPDVYKVIFEDNNFRVIEAIRKAGVHDKPHSHTSPGIIYNITDCKTKTYTPDGKSTDNDRKAGTASTLALTQNHSAETTGSTDCRQIFVEKK